MKLKLLFSLCILVVFTASSKLSYAQMTTHGIECQPASLGQGVNLNLSWNQFGIFNENTEPFTGTGQSFFVICPIQVDTSYAAAGTNLSGATITITGQFLENNQFFLPPFTPGPRSEEITCTIAEIDQSDGGVESSLVLTPIVDPGGTYPTTTSSSTITTNLEFFSGNQDSLVVVCALPAQTRINDITLSAAP